MTNVQNYRCFVVMTKKLIALRKAKEETQIKGQPRAYKIKDDLYQTALFFYTEYLQDLLSSCFPDQWIPLINELHIQNLLTRLEILGIAELPNAFVPILMLSDVLNFKPE